MTIPAGAMQTYSLLRPHGPQFWRKVTCEEFGCAEFRDGWVTRLPYGSELVEYLISGKHGRKFTEITGLRGTEREFAFEPGQPCFRASEHQVRIEREPLYVVRGGSLTQATGRRRQHTTGADWVDDMQATLDGVRAIKERG